MDSIHQDKIHELRLNSEEWKQAYIFLDLLGTGLSVNCPATQAHLLMWFQHADNTQQSSSSSKALTLYLAITALEAFHNT
jgi:hypothetical protein